MDPHVPHGLEFPDSVMKEVRAWGPTRRPLLLLGERGTGKGVLARLLHQVSGRHGFHYTSAAAIPGSLGASILGGHTRGSFTGAVTDRKGLIESAHGGSFFLDELGSASAEVQETLLHVIEDGVVFRLHDIRPIKVDTRVICATNADLFALAAAGEFRADLLDRFGYAILEVPPLRERRPDILFLAARFLREFAAPESPPRLSPEVRAIFLSAPWPGNIRQLKSVCEYIAVHGKPGGLAGPAHLPPRFLQSVGDLARLAAPDLSEDLLDQVVELAAGNKTKAAATLGMCRSTFYRARKRSDSRTFRSA